MSEVKRFDHVNHAHIDDCEHVESSEGAWVTASDYDALAAEAQALREEVAALRARVVVVPDASTVYAALDARERLFTSPENIQVALEAQSRLNGMTVSESALDTLRRFAIGKVMHLNNGLCPDAFEGHEARDPDCPVCRALIETGKESDNV
ncbi:hypothetical protein [Pseudomonas aeruginosa]|uniref:hypothetical protein n=1 Tax=Pseudomonas aeruginosa TaxID=287 RepID=UPI001C3E0A15|nr:hypothetical protein [Pseudomonas aeruginosa]EKM6335141.1 hypothetical protein [Pseudomonas aeruginosa]EKX0314462.1 hypothetical protein [Pseudomonas aeruginosa]ELF5759321.1 hypothetical protein [Pseudomonas aeruginosa]ELH4229667.1 hypothetical protein [Pseudomonas aeruginosa]MCD2988122.1 hypothetical protein [Pseudomonas aeruginosa]